MLIVDAGFLVALYIRRDKLHQHALSFVTAKSTHINNVCRKLLFFRYQSNCALLNWVVCGGVKIVDIPVAAYCQIVYTVEKYADHDIDFTDASLVWLANEYEQQRILTVDKADFSTFRLKNNQWFHLIEWY